MLLDDIDSIALNNVTKHYGKFTAVDNVSLEIFGGELIILIGPSGSGKTTILKMINRIVEPDEGQVFINRQNVKDFDEVKLRRSIGYVIQQIGLFPHMTVKENISLLLKLEKYSKEEIENRVNKVLDLVALPEKFADRYPHQLSGGQQQRVGLARALALDPPLLIMDEPFGALDPILRKQLQDEFLKIKKSLKKTIVFVTHDIEEAFKLGDRIAVINNGKIIQVGYPEELLLNPANEFVEKLVDADKKFKHLNTLKVKDVMIDIDPYLIEINNVNDMEKDTIIKIMNKRGIELAVIVNNGVLLGILEFKNFFKFNDITNSIDKPLVFSPNDFLASVLSEMKAKKASFGIVINEKNERPAGILLANDILLKLL